MNALPFPGAFYGDALPHGEFAVLYPERHVDTHLGAVDFLDATHQPLYLVCSAVGGFKFAGVSWRGGDQALEWDGQWTVHPTVAYGMNPVIYDWAGVLHVNTPATSVGAQGFRYIAEDGRIVSGDESTAPRDGHDLHESVDLSRNGDTLVIGQRAVDGDAVHVWDGHVHRRVVDGPCRTIHGHRDGDAVSIATRRLPGATHGDDVMIVWATVGELKGLPVWTAPPAPTPTTPTPPLPPQEIPMQIPSNVFETIHEFVAAFPIPHGDGSEAWVDQALRKYWTLHLAQQLRFSHGSKWGTKSRDANAPQSKESVAFKDGDDLHVWDLLVSAGSGNPTLAEDPEHHHVNDQHFIAVDAVDHLNRRVRSDVIRPALPFLRSISSFDWHITQDPEWLTFVKSLGSPTLRLVVHSVFRESGKFSTSEAIRRLRVGLEVLKGERLTAAVTFHTDTRERGDTKDSIRTRTQMINAVVKDFPDTVVAARLWNENSHPVEQWFACESEFLKELDKMVDSHIPLAWGAGHGGETVNIFTAGGSWIAHHGDRSKTPEENAVIMRQGQDRFDLPVVDDEPIGFEATARAGRRVSDPDWARRQAQSALAWTLGGTTYHCNAGIWAEVALLDTIQRDAARVFSEALNLQTPPPLPPKGTDVTPEQIAQVFAGAFFERISAFLNLGGSVDARRPQVHGWITETATVINDLYAEIFKRPCDLEGYGSRVLLLLDGASVAELKAILLRGYANGDR